MRTYQVNSVREISYSVSWVNGVLDYQLKSVLKAVQVGLITQEIRIVSDLQVGSHMTAVMIPAVRRQKTSRKHRITLPAVKLVHRVIGQITMPAHALTSLRHRCRARKTAMTSTQAAGLVAMNIVRWHPVQRA